MNYFTPEEQEELNDLFELRPPAVIRSKFHGYNISPGYSVDAMKYTYEKWNIRKNDVFVVSYPKTGNAVLFHYLFVILKACIIHDRTIR